jgi:hypothetical protein
MTAFRVIGRDLVWGTFALTEADAERLMNLIWDDQIAARAAHDTAALERADALATELLDALTKARRHRGCISQPQT